MGYVSTTIDAAGRFVVPKDMRQALGIEGGAELMLSVRDGALICMTRAEALRRLQAALLDAKPGAALLSEELIAERRQEAARLAERG